MIIDHSTRIAFFGKKSNGGNKYLHRGEKTSMLLINLMTVTIGPLFYKFLLSSLKVKNGVRCFGKENDIGASFYCILSFK